MGLASSTRIECEDVRQTLQSRVARIRWDDIEDVRRVACPLLKEVASDAALLGTLVRQISNDASLRALSESYDLLLKLVLIDFTELRCRLRMHIFLPGNYDRPHNHRWPYATHIVRGRYRHVVFRCPDENATTPQPGSLNPLLVEEQIQGSGYALHNDAVHAVYADPYTVSLVLRGPPCSERFFVMDQAEGRTWWQYGRASESAEEIELKRLRDSTLQETIVRLQELGAID